MAEKKSFESSLKQGPQRFLAYVIEHGLAAGRRSAADFIRHFPPSAMMAGLEQRPDLRADILEPTTGTRRKIALKKSVASSAEDLQLALDEQVATAEDVVSLLSPDDCVRYFDNQALWSYAVEGDFWRNKGPVAKEHVAFMLERALTDKVIAHSDLVDGVSVEQLAGSLPRELLAKVISCALERGRGNKPFTEADLLEVAAARLLVEDVSLEHIWETVIEPKIAVAHGLSAAVEEQATAKPALDKVAGEIEAKKASSEGPTPAESGASARAKPGTWSGELAEIEEIEVEDEVDIDEFSDLIEELGFEGPQATTADASPIPKKSA